MPPTSRALWIWLPVVVGLVGGLGWVALRSDTPPSEELGVEEPPVGATGGAADEPIITPTHRPPPAPTHPDAAGVSEPSPALSGQRRTAQAMAEEVDALLKRREYAEARELALSCLAAHPGDRDCHQLRVYSYTRQHPIGETRDILWWCVSALKEDLNCLRALRQFHLSRGERLEASGIATEIRDQWPYDSVEFSAIEAPRQEPAEAPRQEPEVAAPQPPLDPEQPADDPGDGEVTPEPLEPNEEPPEPAPDAP